MAVRCGDGRICTLHYKPMRECIVYLCTLCDWGKPSCATIEEELELCPVATCVPSPPIHSGLPVWAIILIIFSVLIFASAASVVAFLFCRTQGTGERVPLLRRQQPSENIELMSILDIDDNHPTMGAIENNLRLDLEPINLE